MTDNLKNLFEFFKTNKFEQGKKTIDNWLCEVKRLTKDYPDDDKLKAFNDIDYIIKIVNSIESIASRQKFISNISQVIKFYGEIHISDENKKKLDKINRETSIEHTNSRAMHNTPKKEYINWIELYKLFDCYPENSIEYLFIATCLLIPPRRRDWKNAIFVREKPKEIDIEKKNYVIIYDNNTVELLFYHSKISNYVDFWNKILNNSNFGYLDACPLFNPNKLAKLLINSYNSNPREQVFSYNTVYQKVFKKNKLNFDLCPDDIRHSFADYIWIDNSKMQNYYIYSITKDIGETNPMTFRSYSRLGKEEQQNIEVKSKELSKLDILQEKLLKFENENEKIDLQIKELNIIKSNNLDKINEIQSIFSIVNKYIIE